MSVLLLDAGNTRLKWALCERGAFLQQGVFAYEWETLPAQFDQQWATLPTTVEKLLLCNVAGDRLEAPLRQWLHNTVTLKKPLQETSPLTIESVTPQRRAFGVQCAYQQPAQLGADRWAALVAARQHIAGASCVIDCGTALTIDVLNDAGVHVGGLIAPGVALMRESLRANTAQVTIEDSDDLSIFSVQDTASAVQAGIMAAITGALQQVLQQCRDRGLQTPVCVITGGDAQVLLPLLPTLPEGSVHDAQWVLKGLAIIAGCDQ